MASLHKTKPSIIKLLYQLMYDFHSIVTDNDLTYWTCGGTTLGAVRHKSMIPWDDDLDVCIKYNDRKQFLSLESSFKKCGYYYVKTWFGYKVCIKGRKLVTDENYSFPNVDVFFFKQQDTKWIPVYKQVRDTWPKEYYFDSQLFPLKEYQFGEFVVYGPKDALRYLNRMYGKDWNKVAYREYDHAKEEEVEKVIVKLTNKDRMPAQPTKIRERRCLKN